MDNNYNNQYDGGSNGTNDFNNMNNMANMNNAAAWGNEQKVKDNGSFFKGMAVGLTITLTLIVAV